MFDETPNTHESRIKRCRSCDAQIIWFTTKEGRKMPVEANTVSHGETELDLKKHKSHFAFCPAAHLHRKLK